MDRHRDQVIARQCLTEHVYELLRTLPRFDSHTPLDKFPENGIHFFFERGETVSYKGAHLDRIVRIGTHTADGKSRSRIHQHYCGNKNASVFRKNLGAA